MIASRETESCPATPGHLTLTLVNDERRLSGLPPLVPDRLLISAATAQAAFLARTGGMGHEGRDGSTPDQRVTATGYAWTSVGENAASGQVSAAEVVAGWMKSVPHRLNILQPKFTAAGVAMIEVPASQGGRYWVMVFAAGSEAPSPGALRCHP